MRILALTIILYSLLAFWPAPDPPTVAAARFVKADPHRPARRKRKRVRRERFRKPPHVVVLPDVVEVVTWEEWCREERARKVASWVRWF